jgi:hypothetical protein
MEGWLGTGAAAPRSRLHKLMPPVQAVISPIFYAAVWAWAARPAVDVAAQQRQATPQSHLSSQLQAQDTERQVYCCCLVFVKK